MNMKKIKKFFTLARRHDGFTLVELIVVIAILAILGGVAVPAYNGYIKKTNKGVDEVLVGEVKHALELAYYSDPKNFKGGIVVLSLEDAPDTLESEEVETALEKVFGTGWEDLRLKYDGWSATFQDSNFYGDMPGLIAKVNNLTGSLGAALEMVESLGGSGFNSYMNAMGIDPEDSTAKANASVFYIADNMANMSSEDLVGTCQVMVAKLTASSGSPEGKALAAMDAMDDYTESDLSSAALMYAMATGYAEYYDAQHPDTVGQPGTPSAVLQQATLQMSQAATNGDIRGAADAFKILGVAFQDMINLDRTFAQSYALGEAMANDAYAYADALKTVSAGKDGLLNNSEFDLSESGVFGSDAVKELLNVYSEGGVFVIMRETETGMEVISSIDE